ncbi:hypothetical protein TNCV_4689951 [Trichonephila clavipes]|nr:hypothetical protein TNCV_4689951 [Trichonephila clavipes]
MLVKNVLRRRRSHYQHLTEFERGLVIQLRRRCISYPYYYKKKLAGMYPVYMFAGSTYPGKTLSQEIWCPYKHGSPLKEKSTVFSPWLRSNLMHLQQK